MHRTIRTFLLAGAALSFSAGAALAQQTDPRVTLLEQQLRDVQAAVDALKKAQANADNSAALSDLKRSTSSQYDDLTKQIAALPKITHPNGRFTFASADGDFSLALRALVQFDAGYLSQGRNPTTVDLNSGTNFRRAQLGFQGTVFRDWSYNFIYDFGGYGAEGRGYIYNAYIEYDGLKPFFFRIGAYTPPEGLEDQTGSGDLLFPERASAVDIARNIAGAPSREAASIFAQGDDYLVSLSYTGKKTGDNTSTGAVVPTFDAQQALIGRAAWLAVSTPDIKWLVEGHLTDVLKLSDPAAGSAATVMRFSNGPEVAVDPSKTVDTGTLDAKSAREFGFESAGTFQGFYAQGGWFRYELARRLALPNPHFTGWYGLLTYSLTGEQHPYDPATASFRNLRPNSPFSSGKGWGAWELAARYSSIDLNFQPFTSAASGGVAGGKQDVWTLGINWYPNNAIKFQLDYDNLQVAHPNAPANDISASAIVLRSQIAL
ncbi:MAG: hypothetical protein JO256_15195 [Alphaproteobacteria bacterium]|nr:hypothetical protein [Alphaproteobacteria bacterium]